MTEHLKEENMQETKDHVWKSVRAGSQNTFDFTLHLQRIPQDYSRTYLGNTGPSLKDPETLFFYKTRTIFGTGGKIM